tara:strand:+ start:3265 stop:4455 length:1191 start_codon:yes stop_codon:yes gene_type:complete
MALSTTISALTREKFIPVLVDNIFNSNALNLKLLKNAEKLDGGVKINVPVETVANTNKGWITAGTGKVAGAALSQALVETADKAVYDWATSYSSIVIASDEQHINMGSSAVLSLLKSKLKNAEKSMKDLFGVGAFAAAKVTDGLNTLNGTGTFDGGETVAHAQAHDNGNGLIHDLSPGTFADNLFLPEGGVANSIIGYDRSLGGITSGTPGTNDYWNSNLGTFEFAIGTVAGESGAAAIDESNDTGAVSFANFCSTTAGVAGGIKAMTQMYGACTIDNDQPDLIVTTQVIFDAYETALQANKRWAGDATLGDAGFQTLQFKGASVVVDSNCPAGHMYFLNTKYLDYKVHAKRNFAFEDFKPLEAADSIQARLFWMGQLTCSNPRMQGLLVGGPTGY